MNRTLTNAIRWTMDELVPAVVRDSKPFMWPFYCLAYRTLEPRRYMEFKSRVWTMGPEEYAEFYRNLNSISRNRTTDNNVACIDALVEDCRDADGVLDVGCGRGFVLNHLGAHANARNLTGVDLLDEVPGATFRYLRAPADALPFEDGAFDVVTCTHVLEHLVEPHRVVPELLRVARRKVVIVVPRQRPFYYTLDEHINFFFYREQLQCLVPAGVRAEPCSLSGDWYMVLQK